MNHRQNLALSPVQRKTINLIKHPVWRAFAAEPLEQKEQVKLSLDAHAAFDEIVHGRGTTAHIDELAVAANTCLVLCERGFGPECEPKIIEGQEAIMRIKTRCLQGKTIGLDGIGAQALRDMLDIQAQQMEHAGQAEVAMAILEVHKRAKRGHTFKVAAA
jgi:hypothetical protein